MDTVARARACIGARFRLQGRDPANGLDCVGLAAFACGIAAPPARYAVRGGDVVEYGAAIDACGLSRVQHERPGDVVLLRTGARQFHMGVLTVDGLVHADARLGRVVERIGPLPWPVIGAWRSG